MKVCVTSQGDNLDSPADPRFGRCGYFIIADAETLEFEAIKNPNVDATGGAGIKSGQLVVGKDVKAVITGKVGPNALKTLEAAGVDMIIGVSGSVRETIERHKKSDFKPSQGTDAGGRGMSKGRGQGRNR